MRKRTIALLVLLAALAGAAVSQAWLFPVQRATAENIISYGSLTMELHEMDQDGQDVSAAPTLRLTQTPFQTVTRTITVENKCQEDMYLRMRLSIGGTSADGEAFTLMNGDGADAEVTYAANESGGWQDGGDGWYYYSTELTPGITTEPLLKEDKLEFQTNQIARTHSNELLTLSVEVQAVQSKHNGTDARFAQGWPEEVSKP